MVFILPFAIIAGYLLGSIPGGYVVGKLAGGIDVRESGSGNIGTTNVLRTLGKKHAFFAFLIDFGKGIASIYVVGLFPVEVNLSLTRSLAGFACISGHNWPLFLGFRGGKGVASSAGVFLILTPLPLAFALLTMIAVVAVTRYVSLGSMISAVALPFYIWVLMGTEILVYILLGAVVAGLIIWRHHSNLKRLLIGEENKLGQKIRPEETG